VQQEAAKPRQAQSFTVQSHITGFGVDCASRVGDDFAVDRDPSVANVLFTVSSAVDSGHCNEFLQPHHG
jgi:hypothetical protein